MKIIRFTPTRSGHRPGLTVIDDENHPISGASFRFLHSVRFAPNMEPLLEKMVAHAKELAWGMT